MERLNSQTLPRCGLLQSLSLCIRHCLPLLLCWISCAPAPGHGHSPLKLVDAPLVVCDGGPGKVEAKIWPFDMPASAEPFMKIGNGSCAGKPYVAKNTSLDRTSCQRYERSGDKVKNAESGVKCYARQVQNSSKPHVVTFLRTSNKAMSVVYSLTDSSKVKKTIVPVTNVTFPSFSSRRLEVEVADVPPRRGKGGGGGGGGHSGGRSRGFARSPSKTPKGLRGNNGHLTGGRTSSGKRSAGHFSNPRNARTGSYGYGHRQLGKNYPLGFSNTRYGLSGWSHYHHHMPLVAASWLGGSYMFSRFHTMCRCLPGLPCRRCNITHDIDGSDDVEWELEDDLRREDIMNTGFIPDDYTYPLLLTVTSIAGRHFNKSHICPPVAWDPNSRDDHEDPRAWVPPPHQDLLFTVTQLEDLATDEVSDPFIVAGIFIVVCALAVGIPLASYCVGKWRGKKQNEGKPKSKAEKKTYAPLPSAFGVTRSLR